MLPIWVCSNTRLGDDPIDQLNFMADQGFTAFEDNGMNTRTIAVQDKMAATMQKRNLTMGVFVAYKDFRNPTLASGKADDRKEFSRGRSKLLFQLPKESTLNGLLLFLEL